LRDYQKYFFENLTLVVWLASFVVAARISGSFAMAYVPITALIMKARGKNLEVLLGFLFLVILSDSRQPMFEFAQNTKNILIIILTMFFFTDYKNYVQMNRLFARFVPFILIALICLIYSPVVETSIQKTLSYLLVLLVIPNMFQQLLYDNAERTLKGFAMLLSLVLFSGIVLKFLSPEFVTLEGRFTGIFGNPNGIGIYASLCFAFMFIINHTYPGLLNKFWRWGILGMLVISIWWCGSRNALFAILLFTFFRNIYNISPYIGFIIFLILMGSFTYIQNNLSDIILGLGLEETFRIETLESGSGRTVAWDFAWEQIDKDPYIGKGFAYTEWIYRQNYDYLSMLGHQGNAHNSYLTLWMDTGIIGLIAFAVGLIGCFVQASRTTIMAIPAMYMIIFSANFESWLAASLNPVTSVVWMMLTLMTFVPVEETDEEENAEELEALPEPTPPPGTFRRPDFRYPRNG
jgi:O-antigen ligase